MSAAPAWDEQEDRRIVPVHALDMVLEAGGWPELEPHRAEIEACFAERVAANPHLWNGAILLLRRSKLENGLLRGAFRQTDFASFLWWQAQGWPNMGLRNAFALNVLEGSDGGFVLGIMAPHTAVGGRIYFPGGTPDLSDVTCDGRVDLVASCVRELAEETGLHSEDVAQDLGFTAVYDGPRLALLRRLVFPEPAHELALRIRAFLGREALPEFSDVLVVRDEQDLVPAIVPFAADYLRSRWGVRRQKP